MAKLTKPELMETYLEEHAEIKKVELDRVIKTFVDFIHTSIEVMEEDDSFTIPELGTFSLVKRSARTGRNPRNPEETIEIPESYSFKFKMAKAIKDQINE